MSLSSADALKVAIEAAHRGAEVLREQYDRYHVRGETLKVHTKSSAIDVVTETDALAQKEIISVIQKHYPDHRFLAEEEGADALGKPESPYIWIIDPLDGTQNFVHGKTVFGSIVGLMKNEELLLGAMELPLMNERFYGGKGLGAFYNDKQVTLRKTKDMTDAVLCCNISHRAKELPNGTHYVTIPYCASIENTGCAADELGLVLKGHTDGVFYDGIKLWDVCVGYTLLKEVGGKYAYTFKEPGNLRSGLLSAASTNTIFDPLWEFVQTKM